MSDRLGGSFDKVNKASKWLLVYPLILSAPFLLDFMYPSASARFSDITITHFPNMVYLRESLGGWDTIPLWSPMILSGFPFAADPLSGLWYPPGWIALILPAPFGFNLLAYLHLVWGGIGMYRLMRAQGLDCFPALMGGLAFGSMPKLFAHYGAGHLTLVFAVAWTPWVLVTHLSRRGFFQPGVVLGIIFLADVRWAVFAGLLWVAWVVNRHTREGDRLVGAESEDEIDRNHFRYIFLQGLLAAGISAPLAIPFAEYILHSTRWNLPFEEVFTFSLPAARILGVFFPDFGGFHEWMLYPGGMVFVLGSLAITIRGARKRVWFWIWVGLLSLLFSLGESLPLLPFLGEIPPFNLLRVPSRALFLTGMVWAVLCAHGMEHLMAGLASADKKRSTLVLIGLGGFAIVMLVGVFIITGAIPTSFAWGGLVLLISVALIVVVLRGPNRWLMPIFIIVSLIDWGVVNLSLFDAREPSEVFSEQEEVARYLASREGRFRVYSPSYSLPQHTSARFGLELADGVAPMQLASYAAFMTQATGVPREGYSVTIPSFDGDPAEVNQPYLPDPVLLGRLNVRYVVAEYDLNVKGLDFRERFGNTRVYENSRVLPRAWVQPIAEPVGNRAVEVPVDWSPNRISAHLEGPGLLVLSEVVYPGWHVWVDGERGRLNPVAGILRGVEVHEGEHEVVFVYRPMSMYIGLGILMLVLIWFGWKVLLGQPRGLFEA